MSKKRTKIAKAMESPKKYSDIKLDKQVQSKTDGQFEYMRTIGENDITFCCGLAGTGKTAIAVGMAAQYLAEGRVNKIVVTRPIIECGRGIGFLAGGMHEKVHYYFIPIVEELNSYLGTLEVKGYIADGTIEIAPLEFMRGRNFHNYFMILDEAQNADLDQIKMFLTRIGRNSTVVINGDTEQSDINNSGLATCIDRLDGCSAVGISKLTEEDIIRNKIIGEILKRLSK